MRAFARREAIHLLCTREEKQDGLLRYARNDGVGTTLLQNDMPMARHPGEACGDS
jgi:hypothetical protein